MTSFDRHLPKPGGSAMQKASKSVGLTYEDLCRLPDDGMRHELIDGELYVTPAPRFKHQLVASNVAGHMFMYLREHPLGHVYHAPLDVVFSNNNVVEPDILYLSYEREARQSTELYLAGAPDLIVEILSPSTKRIDLGVKLHLYERFEVPEYWIIDPQSETVRVYRLEEGQLKLITEVTRGDATATAVIFTPILPGFQLSLDEIFATGRLTMEDAPPPVRLTYQDLRRLPDDGLRHELIDGEHCVSPSPKPIHQRVSGRLFFRISNYLEEYPLGQVYYAPLDVVFDEHNAVEPDLLYLSREREARQMTEDNLEGTPDLMIEILSPLTKHRDQGVKLRLYERFEVSEYWILDPEKETVSVFRFKNGRLQLVDVLSRRESTSNQALATPLLPGLAIPLGKVFD